MKSLETTVGPRTKIIFLLLVLLVTGCGSKNEQVAAPPVKVNVVKAIANDVPLYEDFVAQVYGESDVDIRSRVEGWVMSVNFKEGSKIKKGDLLYVIDDVQYKTAVDREASELASAKTEMIRSQNELSRVKPLTELNALSQKDLDNAQASYDAAQAQVKASEALASKFKNRIGLYACVLPFNGVAGMSNVRAGDYVSRVGRTSVLTTVSSISAIRVRFQISEQSISGLQK
jgi:membrane fusion protein (multidrug efflux system)